MSEKKEKTVKQRVISYAGALLMIASLLFIVHKLSQYAIDVERLTDPFVLLGLFVMTMVYGVSVFVGAISFHYLLRPITGVALSLKQVSSVYCVANLYKYLPGNVMQFVGRNKLAFDREDISHGSVITATILETIILLISAFAFTIACVFDQFWEYLLENDVFTTIALIGLVLVLLCAVVVFLLRRKWADIFAKYILTLRRISLSQWVVAFLLACIRLMIMTFTFVGTILLCGGTMTIVQGVQIAGLFAMAWMIGLVVPGAPGGLGIREAVLLMSLEYMVDNEIVMFALLIHRVMTILGDVVGWLISLIIKTKKRPITSGEENVDL